MAVVDFFRRVEVNMLCDFCFKFNSLNSSERILKIGRDLTKLLPKFGSTLFLRHSVDTYGYDHKNTVADVLWLISE